MRILFIPCQHPRSLWFVRALQESGHSLQRAEDLHDGVLLAANEVFDAVIATAFGPMDHHALLAGMSELTAAVGAASIVAILGRSDPAERISILYAGASACLSLPLSSAELHERLHALLRLRHTAFVTSIPAKHGLELDLASLALTVGHERITVTRREGLLLDCLIRHFDVPVPREQLIRYAWPEADYVDPSNINLMVTRLRQKLDLHLPRLCIRTVRRYGYQISIRSQCLPVPSSSQILVRK